MGTFATVFATGALGYALPSFGSRLTLMMLPSGIAVAAAYRWGFGMWLPLLAAGAAIELSIHQPLIAAIGVGIGLAGGAVLSAWILKNRGFDPRFEHARDVPIYIAAAAIGMTLAPTFGRLGYWLAHVDRPIVGLVYWMRWWSSAMAGALVLAPVLIAAGPGTLAPMKEHRLLSPLWMWGIAVCCALMLLPIDARIVLPPLLVYALILVIVGAMYFGLVATASASLVLWLWAAYCIAFNRGAFADFDDLAGRTMIWSLGGLLTGVTLIITALLAERDAAAREKLRAEQRYAHIFDGSPQPIWLVDPVTRRILMANAAAVRQYGWSQEQMLSMTANALIAPGEPETPTHEFEPYETRHVTHDGKILQVELWSRLIALGGETVELVFAQDVTERRAFGQALVDAVAGEQRRIGQEMHDGLGQELTGLALSVRALANRAARERDSIAADLEELATIASGCIKDARLIVQGLSPLSDAEGSLETALEALAARSSLSGIVVRFRARYDAPLDLDLKSRNHLYRIAQEAVQNALKHSGARTIEIELIARAGSVRLEVRDDGCGLPETELQSSGLGLRTMRFRASAIGGRLTFARRPGGGNSVLCEAPQPLVRARARA